MTSLASPSNLEKNMAAGCGGKHTRFPFLETVRSLMATVVTVLVVSVLVTVLVVVSRPVEMVFRSDSYIQADDWWRNVTDDSSEEPSACGPAPAQIPVALGSPAYGPAVAQSTEYEPAKQVRASKARLPPVDELGSPAYGPAVASVYEPEPAKQVEILLALTAVNPSSHTDITGSIDKIRVIDNLNMVEICFFEPTKLDVNASVNFDLKPHIRHRYRRWVRLCDSTQLQYLYNNHLHDAGGFSVLLVVETTYGPKGDPTKMKKLSYYCSPVNFVRYATMGIEEQDVDVTCKTAQDMGYKANFKSTTSCNATNY